MRTKVSMTVVVPFQQPPDPPELTLAQFRLHVPSCNIRLTVRDEADREIVIEYGIISKPADFDLSRLERAWSRWKGIMGRAT